VLVTSLYGRVTPPKEISPLRAMNSFAIVFFFHCPKEKFFYVYYSINIKLTINVEGLLK
jgi:hypothetical protein